MTGLSRCFLVYPSPSVTRHAPGSWPTPPRTRFTKHDHGLYPSAFILSPSPTNTIHAHDPSPNPSAYPPPSPPTGTNHESRARSPFSFSRPHDHDSRPRSPSDPRSRFTSHDHVSLSLAERTLFLFGGDSSNRLSFGKSRMSSPELV